MAKAKGEGLVTRVERKMDKQLNKYGLKAPVGVVSFGSMHVSSKPVSRDRHL